MNSTTEMTFLKSKIKIFNPPRDLRIPRPATTPAGSAAHGIHIALYGDHDGFDEFVLYPIGVQDRTSENT